MISTTVTALGLGILAAPGLVGGDWDERAGNGSISALPSDNPRLGLVYQGLKLASDGAPCVGAYQLGDPRMCTHGPDEPLPGLDVTRDVNPIARTEAAPALPKRDTSAAPSERDILADWNATAPAEHTLALAPADGGGVYRTARADGDAADCQDDGQSGSRVQLLYAYEAGSASRLSRYIASFRDWATQVDAMVDASAKETGGSRRVRYVVTSGCEVDLREVQLPAGALDNLDATITALKALGLDRADRKYLIFADVNVYCGIGTFVKDDLADASNRNNRGPSYGRADAGCWNAAVLAHELTHTLGGVQDTAPHSNGTGHCVDDHDLMCSTGANPGTVKAACPDRAAELRLDCGHDDYFSTNPAPGSYLATHWNIASSDFLVDGAAGATPGPGTGASAGTSAGSGGVSTAASDGTTTSVSPLAAAGSAQRPTSAVAAPGQGAVTKPDRGAVAKPGQGAVTKPDQGAVAKPGQGAVTKPDPNAVAPTGAAAASPAAAAGSAASGKTVGEASRPPRPSSTGSLVSTDTTSTATRLGWPSLSGKTRFLVVVNGRTLGSTTANRIRVIGLRPATNYQMRVAVREANGTARPYTSELIVRTSEVRQPVADTPFELDNALSPAAASVYGARTADGTPLVLARQDGSADQRWRLRPVGDGRYLLSSAATGKCVAPMGPAVLGAVVIQRSCQPDDSAQHWRVTTSAHGFTLVTDDSNLVIGVSRLRYGGERLLVLQRPRALRYQSWSAMPV